MALWEVESKPRRPTETKSAAAEPSLSFLSPDSPLSFPPCPLPHITYFISHKSDACMASRTNRNMC